uniref:Uncharacterized protein n=1 Tax=Anopheles maculatus TaxID=74869 RepID=A0A182SMW6_9DIPT
MGGGNGFQKAAGPLPSAFSDDVKLANFRGGFILARQPTAANQTMVLLMMTMMILLSVTVRRKGSRASGRDGLFLENELDEGGVEIVSDFPDTFGLYDAGASASGAGASAGGASGAASGAAAGAASPSAGAAASGAGAASAAGAAAAASPSAAGAASAGAASAAGAGAASAGATSFAGDDFGVVPVDERTYGTSAASGGKCLRSSNGLGVRAL